MVFDEEGLPEVLPAFPDFDQDGDAVLASQSPTKSGTATSSTGLTETTVQPPPRKKTRKATGGNDEKSVCDLPGCDLDKAANSKFCAGPEIDLQCEPSNNFSHTALHFLHLKQQAF